MGIWAEIISLPETIKQYPVTPKESFNGGLRTELDIWLEETKAKNLSLDELKDAIFLCSTNIWGQLEGVDTDKKAKILYDKWNGVGKGEGIYEQIQNMARTNFKYENLNLEHIENAMKVSDYWINDGKYPEIFFTPQQSDLVDKSKYFKEEQIESLESLINNL